MKIIKQELNLAYNIEVSRLNLLSTSIFGPTFSINSNTRGHRHDSFSLESGNITIVDKKQLPPFFGVFISLYYWPLLQHSEKAVG